MRRAGLALIAGALLFGMPSAGALAGTAGPIAVSVTPTAGVANGEAVAVHATAPAGVLIYELRAHLCVPGPNLRTNFDFGFQGRRCTNVAVGSGDVERTAAFPSGVTDASLDGFKVGAGTVHWVNELGYDQTIDCGPGRPCDLVVRVQITNDTVFYTAPLCYSSICPTDGRATPTTSWTPPGGAGSSTSTTSSSASAATRAGTGEGRAAKASPGGLVAPARSSDARAAGHSGQGSIDAAAGASSTSATITAPWSMSRTLLVGLTGAIAGAAATALIGHLRRRRSQRLTTIGSTAVAVVVLALLLSACNSNDKTSTGSTTSSPAGSARITKFVVPKSVQCGRAPSTKVRVTYAVSGAKSHQLVIDGRVEAGKAESATVDAPVHCDDLPHTVALVALDAAGGRTSEVKYLTTELAPG